MAFNQLMMATLDEPDLVAHFLDVCVEVLVRCATLQFEIGIHAYPSAVKEVEVNMMSPQMY